MQFVQRARYAGERREKLIVIGWASLLQGRYMARYRVNLYNRFTASGRILHFSILYVSEIMRVSFAKLARSYCSRGVVCET